MISAKHAKKIAKSKYLSKRKLQHNERKLQRDELDNVLQQILDTCNIGSYCCYTHTIFENTHLKLRKLGYSVTVSDSLIPDYAYKLYIKWD